MTALFQTIIEETDFLGDVPCFKTATAHDVSVHVGAYITVALMDATEVLPVAVIVGTRKLLTDAAWVQIEANEAENEAADNAWADRSCYDKARIAALIVSHNLNISV